MQPPIGQHLNKHYHKQLSIIKKIASEVHQTITIGEILLVFFQFCHTQLIMQWNIFTASQVITFTEQTLKLCFDATNDQLTPQPQTNTQHHEEETHRTQTAKRQQGHS